MENMKNNNTTKDINGVSNRYTDKMYGVNTPYGEGEYLPRIEWSKIGHIAPEFIETGERKPEDPLPKADLVIITWTSAEWFAINHVFIDSDKESYTKSYDWRDKWNLYNRGASEYHADKKSGELWGHFAMVKITDLSGRPWRVLLFKSNSHLAHSPWIGGLEAMMKCILSDTQTNRVYTIGTAGGARLDQTLGDAVITNSAILELQRPENTSDKSNGNSFRCPTWYPSVKLTDSVSKNLMLKMSSVANDTSMGALFKKLKSKHANDPTLLHINYNDLINEPLSKKSLKNPQIHTLKNVPLLTTDFYYVATGNNSDEFAFLEMDDAVIAKEANAMGVDFACIRNISDPIVPCKTESGITIPETIRNDWSGMIYSTFGLYTSFNGALATWATIAGDGANVYNPKREIDESKEDDPIEVKLAYEVRSCGKCNFFWPENKADATYGPYTSFDFDVNQPYPAKPEKGEYEYPWILGRTNAPSFPNGEIIDGCRKAPIMTIGINPNLTAFSPGQNGAPWSYPSFSSDNGTNEWTKYAWYYRYRSVYQEKLSMDFIKKYVLPDGVITAPKDGKVVADHRYDASPEWSIKVKYDGDTDDTTIEIPGKKGDFPYMMFFNAWEPDNEFKAGDIIAGKVAVPEGIQTQIFQEQQGYYMQFVPTLDSFADHLTSKGCKDVKLEVGEDVSQIDMVGCASPHWKESYLGNQMKEIVDNCVSKNAWAVKQMVQSRPAVLYIVSESSWRMFHDAFGKFVDKGKISDWPEDASYTLLRETTDLNNPVYIRFNIDIDGMEYNHKIRLVITPHFSFSSNFVPQYRMSPDEFKELSENNDFKNAITEDNGFDILPADEKHPDYFREIQLNSETYMEDRENLKKNYPELYEKMDKWFYDPHDQMASVLKDMYDKGEMTYDNERCYLQRADGACKFCVNSHWQFKGECWYDKTKLMSPPAGYLEKVAEYIVENGKPEKNKIAQTIKAEQ